MRLEPISNDFNAEAAAEYVEFAKQYPDEAEYIVKLLAAAEIERIMDEDGDAIIAKTFDDNYEMLKKSLARGIANGTMSDEAVDATVEAVEIAKAAYRSNQPWNEQKIKRDKGGKFSKVRYTGGAAGYNGAKNASMNYKGMPSWNDDKDAGFMKEKYIGQYRQAAQVLGNLIASSDENPGKVTIKGNKGKSKVIDLTDNDFQQAKKGDEGAGAIGHGVLQEHAKEFFDDADDDVIDSFRLGDEGPEVDPDNFNQLTLRRKDPKTKQYDKRKLSIPQVKGMPKPLNDPTSSGTSRNMQRLGQAAGALQNSGVVEAANLVSPGAAAGVAGGLQAAQFVGDYGPMADRVMGPGVRRAFYRFSGKEKRPEQAMVNTMRADVRGAASPQEARDAIFVPRMETKVTSEGYEDVPVPSKTMRFWQKKLPDVELLNLHTSSGATPPSEGVILDKNGKAVAMSVGSHDDHYLPFNLKRMNRAKGGEYIRTRSLGGLTSEDIDGGIIGGTKGVTVVSHSGIFTMQFSPSGKGSLSKARRVKMRKRYEQLVDSLASKKVNVGQVPKDRRNEIQAQVERQMPGTTAGVVKQRKAKVSELLRQEQENPQPSAERKAEWTEEFLRQQGEDWTDKGGEELGVDQLREEVRSQARRRSDKTLRTDEEIITEMGASDKYEKFMRQKEGEYSTALGPLRTNGAGYYKAMQALKEQFPYDIAEVNWTPPDSTSVGSGATDPGYVKAKHNRPDKVLTGFWDSEIEGQKNTKGKLKGTGKRKASADNYANSFNRERLRNIKDEGADAGPKGEGGSAANADSGVGGSDDSYDSGGGYSSQGIRSGKLGPRYTQFKPMENAKNIQMTDYQKVNQLMKIRRAMKNVGTLTYIQTTGNGKEKVTFDPWDTDSDANQTANDNYPNLFAAMSNGDFDEKLQTNEKFADEVAGEVQRLYQNSQKSDRGIAQPLARALQEKKLFDGLIADEDGRPVGTAKNPTTALGLVSSLQSGEPSNFDFTSGHMDGSLYLPGLAQREHRAAWHADSDIETFSAQSKDRFGIEITDKTDPRTIRRLSKKFGDAMREGLDASAKWKKQIAEAGGRAEDVSDQTLIKYGGQTYSMFAAKELEDQIAQDALGMAKTKQLRQVIRESSEKEYEDNEEMKEISIEDMREMRYEDHQRDPRLVGSLKFPKQGTNQKKLDSAKQNLDKLVGLGEVKGELDSLISDAKVSAQRKEKGLKSSNKTMHLVFTGNPGTGKTTVANELARAYNALGLIPEDKVVVASRADLVGQYAGHTAAKTRKKFSEAKGGVLFIDEAYSLVNSNDDTFGFEAVDELVAQSENNRDNTVVIMAGYKDDMGRLMGANPGLKSRFPRTIDFPDYKAGDLKEIQRRGVKESDYEYSDGVEGKLESITRKMVNQPNYSNARDARNFREMMFSAQAQRVNRKYGDSATKEQLTAITPEDVDAAEKMYFKQRTGGITKRLERI